MYIRVPIEDTSSELKGSCEGTLSGFLQGSAEASLFLSNKLGGGKHYVLTYRTEDPPREIELYPYERLTMQVFNRMDGPYGIAAGANGKWIRFEVDVGWVFWMRVTKDRTELKLAPPTRATFGEIQRQLQRPGEASVSVELSDAPQSSTSEGRVFFWLIKNISGIVRTEANYHVDRRAIAGAIAWEALLNSKQSFTQELRTATGFARFSGPGKVHYRESLTPAAPPGITAAIEIEQRGKLTVQTEERRRQILATTPGALIYIGAIMREFSDIAARSGYYLDCDPPSLTTFYNAWNISAAEGFFSQRKAPMPLIPNPKMGSWVHENLKSIERMVGTPPTGFCKWPRGY